MNQKLDSSRGRANSLYVLFYYLGGSAGITVSGYGYQHFGWFGVTSMGMMLLTVIAAAGIVEMKAQSKQWLAFNRTDMDNDTS